MNNEISHKSLFIFYCLNFSLSFASKFMDILRKCKDITIYHIVLLKKYKELEFFFFFSTRTVNACTSNKKLFLQNKIKK
jgi:hypothetical protein